MTGMCATINLLEACSLITLAPDKTTATIGDVISLIVNAQPSTQSFNIEIRDQDNNLIDTCTTSSTDGTCIISWNTTGKTQGNYTLIASGQGGQCTSAPITISIQPVVVEAGIATVAALGITVGAVYVAITGQGLLGGELLAAGA